ncbi:hypothetical protein ACHRVK_03630 [Flavobacterium plurextorum]|uniref:hypothetical protein n=1 Tax=Flavobacterium plurextorum TaxID=1114867 RepID=UPI003757DA39
MKKYIIYLILFLLPLLNYAQNTEEQELATRSIKDDFKITSIDSSKHYYTIKAVNESNVQVLILQKKLKRKERKKLFNEFKVAKLVVGQSYYFNLENWFYSFAMAGSANDKIIIDNKVIYDKQTSPYFVYETTNLQGVYYLLK